MCQKFKIDTEIKLLLRSQNEPNIVTRDEVKQSKLYF